jgi:hypothetical protein
MMDISIQLRELAMRTAEHMLHQNKHIDSIESTGFYVLSSGQVFKGFTPLYAFEVDGNQFVIAWEKF